MMARTGVLHASSFARLISAEKETFQAWKKIFDQNPLNTEAVRGMYESSIRLEDKERIYGLSYQLIPEQVPAEWCEICNIYIMPAHSGHRERAHP